METMSNMNLRRDTRLREPMVQEAWWELCKDWKLWWLTPHDIQVSQRVELILLVEEWVK